ncbi:tetratricopeptide repeat protein [Roseovarius faecimaris]|uniref:Tetratricopeptide repeat protein n=1 Tax=Roseovarius faecimaris TaxID=2494550 RepID=A0A6I6IRQ8_9RHOB|nr:tetratricopeptide repeat protein [Roseovarius faecimaris]QGX99850.1 tetratricopeptide repeat protein [Roseovarius faecimaris]
MQVKQLEREQGPEAAERALIPLVREFPDAHQAYAALARVLMKQKKNDYAARAAEKAAALAPLEARQHTLLGVSRLRNDDLPGASAAFAQALQLDKKFAPAIVGAAAVKMADENFDDALALCDRALDIDPSLERASELVARINMKQGKTDAAVEELRRLVEQGGKNNRALRAYLRLMRKEGRLDEVVSLAEESLATAPATPQSVARYARMVGFAGQPELAVKQYRALIETGNAREVDRVRYIAALIGAGQLDEARAMIPTLKDRPAMKPLKDKLNGDVALASGRPDAAIELYAAACSGARAPEPDPQELAGLSGEELAQAWQSYTAKALRAALREHRQGRNDQGGD